MYFILQYNRSKTELIQLDRLVFTAGYCHLSVLSGEVNKVENVLEKFDSFV
jgi:hypothetical protein